MYNDGTVVCTFSWWEILPDNCTTCNATACSSTTTNAYTGAAAATATLCACVQGSGYPLLVGKCNGIVHFRLGRKGS